MERLPQDAAEESEEAGRTPPAAHLGRALRLWVRAAWDRLGLMIGVSMTWMLLTAVPLGIAGIIPRGVAPQLRFGAMILAAILIISAPTAGACYVAHLICSDDEASYADFWRGGARFRVSATWLGLVQAIVTTVLLVSLAFYARLGGILGMVATLLCGYVLLFWAMMSCSHFPLLVAQETGVFDEPDRRARRGVLAVLRRSFYLTLGRPLYGAGLLFLGLTITAICTASVVLLPLIWMGVLTLLTTQATRLLLIEFGVVPPPPVEEAIPDDKFRIKLDDKRGVR